MAIIVDKVEKKRQIALGSIDVFLKDGLNKTSVEKIAKHLKVAKGTIYNYFGSKEEIIIEIWDWLCEKHIKYLEEKLKDNMSATDKILTYFKYDEIIDDEEMFQKMFFLYQEYLSAIISSNVNEILFNHYKNHYDLDFNYLQTFITQGVESKEFKDINILETTKTLIALPQGLIIDYKFCVTSDITPLNELHKTLNNFLSLIKRS